MSLQEVSEILGHSNISMTMRYAHLESTVTAKKARDLLNRLNDAYSGPFRSLILVLTDHHFWNFPTTDSGFIRSLFLDFQNQ
jgi:hypothetical protein